MREQQFRYQSDDEYQKQSPPDHSKIFRRCVAACLVGGTFAAMLTTAVNFRKAITTDTRASSSIVTASLSPQPIVGNASESQAGSCQITKRWSSDAYGDIVGFLSPTGAAEAVAASNAVMGASMSPAYVSDLAAIVIDSTPDGIHKVGVHVPFGMSVKIGDHIFFRAGHRDASLPCNWVPNMIAAVIPKH